jgi:hypothetical protein
LGDPNSKNSFYFLADFVPPEERPPRISAGLLDEEGTLLLELRVNRMDKNPGKCTYQSLSGGFQILHPSGKTLLEVRTDIFPRGYLTRINARLFDEHGDLRMEPSGESVQVHGEANLLLKAPFDSIVR